MPSDTIEEEPTTVSRLRAVKKSIQKATHEALKHTKEPVRFQENDEPNASFHLGMELFGQEPAAIEKFVQEKLTEVEHELEDLVEAVHDESMAEDLPKSQSPEELAAEASQLRTKILFLRECSQVRALLDASTNLSSTVEAQPDYVAATRHWVDANQALERAQKVLEDEQASSTGQQAALNTAYKILDSLRTSLRRQKVDLLGRAKSLWQSCVELSPNSMAVRGAGSKDSTNHLETAYQVLELFAEEGNAALEDVLRMFVKSLHKAVFQPAIDCHSGEPLTWTFYESEEKKSSNLSGMVVSTTSSKISGPVHRLEWICEPSKETTSSPSAWKETFELLETVLTFVADRVLLGRNAPCDLVGNRLLGRPNAAPSALNLSVLGLESRRLGDDHGLLMEPLIDSLTATCIPDKLEASKLNELRLIAEHLASVTAPFLHSLVKSGLYPAAHDSQLATFASSVEEKYIKKRRCAILNQARNLLNNTDYHNTVEVGEEVHDRESDLLDQRDGLAVFKLHRCSISKTAALALELCRATMDEAVEQKAFTAESSLSLLAGSLYRSARDVLDLFRAIIPVAHGYEIKNVPRTAGVFHNDCVYFAHHCLTLGLEYKQKFPEPKAGDTRGQLLRQTCMFVDMVPLFRDLADRSLGDMLDLQAQQLIEIIGQRTPLLAEALKSTEILEEWSEAETALTAGLYHLRHLSQAWKPVLSQDILTRSMWYLSDVIYTLFLDQVTKARGISPSACQFVSTLFAKACSETAQFADGDTSGSRVYDRFSAIGRFMDMSLSDIQVALSDGVFRSVTGPELSHLISATFNDNPKRRALLDLLASH